MTLHAKQQHAFKKYWFNLLSLNLAIARKKAHTTNNLGDCDRKGADYQLGIGMQLVVF